MLVWIQNPFDNLPVEGFRKQRYWLMAEAFAAAGHRVVLWTSDFSHASKEKRKIDGSLPVPFGLRLVPTPPYRRNVGWRRVWSHREYAREWRRLALASGERPDAIVASMPTISGALAAVELGRRLGSKVVVDVMDAWPETFERLLPRPFGSLAHALVAPWRRRVRSVYREASLVTGVSERYRALTGRADYFRAYHGSETSAPAERSGSGQSGKTVRLVYAGALGRTYDLDTVLKAVADNPDFTLDIAGRWNRPVPARVRAHGYLDRDSLASLLAECDVGIVPMRDDSWVGMPYKMCDYAQAGLNVVSSLRGDVEELLQRYRCGAVYRHGDAQSLAAAVRLAATLDRSGARRMWEAEFDAAKIYAGYVAAVEKLV